MELLSALGSWAFIIYLVGASFYIAHRLSPGEQDE